MKRSLFLRLILIIPALILLAGINSYAREKPDIIQYDATYLEDAISVNVHWQSPNPVVMVKVSAGKEQKEIEVDEYDNRRNPYGYSGEVTVVVNLEPGVERKYVNYVIQLKDDIGQRSRQVIGKIKLAKAVSEAPPEEAPFEEPPAEVGQPQPTDIVDKLIAIAERHDSAPFMNKVKINRISEGKVNFTSKASDDKGLREVIFRIYDKGGNMVKEQVLTDLGTIWQGTTKTFTLADGNYKIIAQAVDTSGNRSREKIKKFTITGAGSQQTSSEKTGSEDAGTGDTGAEETDTEDPDAGESGTDETGTEESDTEDPDTEETDYEED